MFIHDKIEITIDGETKVFVSEEKHTKLVEPFTNKSDLAHLIVVLERSQDSPNYSKDNPYFIHTRNLIWKCKELAKSLK